MSLIGVREESVLEIARVGGPSWPSSEYLYRPTPGSAWVPCDPEDLSAGQRDAWSRLEGLALGQCAPVVVRPFREPDGSFLTCSVAIFAALDGSIGYRAAASRITVERPVSVG